MPKRACRCGVPVCRVILGCNPTECPTVVSAFGIGLCTEPGDLVLHPFAGSNMTGYVAEQMGRRWLSLELREEYLEGSKFRFVEVPPRGRGGGGRREAGQPVADIQPRGLRAATTDPTGVLCTNGLATDLLMSVAGRSVLRLW